MGFAFVKDSRFGPLVHSTFILRPLVKGIYCVGNGGIVRGLQNTHAQTPTPRDLPIHTAASSEENLRNRSPAYREQGYSRLRFYVLLRWCVCWM